jgi:amino acid transporter
MNQIEETPNLWGRLRRVLIGSPRDLKDRSLLHRIALVPLLAWVGLGADGLSSSSYGPEESYRVLGEHAYLGVFLALATALTVFIISYAYSRIIEHFPTGGGGYVVATSLLGKSAGVLSGSALLVDYALTITTSIASGGEAVFSLLPLAWQPYKLTTEFAAVLVLVVMNLRGVKESVTILIPIFLAFVVSHVLLIGGGILFHVQALPAVVQTCQTGFSHGLATLGAVGMLALFLRAYSMGAGTYTGIEAVSNGLGILREPKVETGKRTMWYMAASLAFTAAGLLVCYMLADVHKVEGQTLNASLANAWAGDFRPFGLPLGSAFVLVTIASEAVLLFVAAQTGFIDGPRVMANMAADSWFPRRFAALSDRLASQNGILLMGFAAFATLWYTRGNVSALLVMYSINVFLTFSLSQAGMLRFWTRALRRGQRAFRDLTIHGIGLLLCLAILGVMIYEKFLVGGWMTLLITSGLILLCLAIRRHYGKVADLVRALDQQFEKLPALLRASGPPPAWDEQKPTAIVLVGGYGGLGLHMLFAVLRLFPQAFHNLLFVSVGAVDSEFFKEGDRVQTLERQTREMLERYVDIAAKAGRPARFECRLGTDVVETASDVCLEMFKQHPQSVVFGGTLVFDRPHWWDRILHNETSYAIQRRLKFGGVPMVVLPILLRTPAGKGNPGAPK